jgi:DNA-binding protein HU-beta
MGETINKVNLGKEIADLVDLPQTTVKKIVDSIWELIKQKLVNGDQVSIAGFGNFYVKVRPARVGRNPRTGEPIQINATNTLGFKASKSLKESVN